MDEKKLPEDNQSLVVDNAVDATATPTQPAEPEAPNRPTPQTRAEVIEQLKEIETSGQPIGRAEVEQLKQVFYKLYHAEVAAAREAFIAAGGDEAAFVPEPDELESDFKAHMGRIKELRAQAVADLEKEKQAGLEKKTAIIEQIKAMAASPEEADKNYDTFKALQAEWKEIKTVPAEQATELWKNYQLYVEQFYDQLRLNHEMRAYDFKKNLEIKTRLCEAAEKLAEVEDPVSAFHQLQKLHQDFRETGPVAKDLREEVWKRFKEASTVVNKRHQAHFENLKAQEEDNLVRKTALCERIEAILAEEIKGFSAWDAKTKEIIDIQAEWKTIGFTPKKVNAKIFERFRTACDAFFAAKTAFYKQNREAQSANLAAKTALLEKAEALKDSTDWNATAQEMIALQKAWKETGPVSHKASEAVWKRFNEACNHFFNRKNEAGSAQRAEEEANLAKKQDIITALKALAENPTDDAAERVKELQAQWNATGYVPFRKKEKIYKAYHEALDAIYKQLHLNAGRRQMEKFRKNVADKGGNELTRERYRLVQNLEAKRQEIANYENNLTFFNAKTKGANALIDEVNRKIERLKEELAVITEKIQAVDAKIAEGE